MSRARAREREALIREASAYAERLRRELPGAQVFLYGSVARGDWNLHSDIDLLVVGDLPAEPLARSALLYRFVQGHEEPKGLTHDEFGKLKHQGKLWYLAGALEL
ncbi:MAG: nucleotidyltransferase domain-containing protein [Truepera sp.]|nr:nucleotidyltransferase domain-containing protein [Truepera sp.]